MIATFSTVIEPSLQPSSSSQLYMLKSRCKVAFAAIWAEKWQKSSNNKSMLIRPRFRLFLSRHLPIMHTHTHTPMVSKVHNSLKIYLRQTDSRIGYVIDRRDLTSRRNVRFFFSLSKSLCKTPSRACAFSIDLVFMRVGDGWWWWRGRKNIQLKTESAAALSDFAAHWIRKKHLVVSL